MTLGGNTSLFQNSLQQRGSFCFCQVPLSLGLLVLPPCLSSLSFLLVFFPSYLPASTILGSANTVRPWRCFRRLHISQSRQLSMRTAHFTLHASRSRFTLHTSHLNASHSSTLRGLASMWSRDQHLCRQPGPLNLPLRRDSTAGTAERASSIAS